MTMINRGYKILEQLRREEGFGENETYVMEYILTQAERYETIRKLNPREFTDIYKENLTGRPFDLLIDEKGNSL